MAETEEKRCAMCGETKPASDFYKNRHNAGGLRFECKECYNKETAIGIENENQIDSVIREMAELQVGIDNEKALCQHRISLVQKYSDEIVEPYLTRMMFWEAKLRKFLKEQPVEKFFRGCRFGTVSYTRGKLKIRLKVDLAKRMMGKP